MFGELHTVINSVYVQTLPTEQASPALRLFFAGSSFAHACKARPPTIVGGTSLSVSLSLSLCRAGIGDSQASAQTGNMDNRGHPNKESHVAKYSSDLAFWGDAVLVASAVCTV